MYGAEPQFTSNASTVRVARPKLTSLRTTVAAAVAPRSMVSSVTIKFSGGGHGGRLAGRGTRAVEHDYVGVRRETNMNCNLIIVKRVYEHAGCGVMRTKHFTPYLCLLRSQSVFIDIHLGETLDSVLLPHSRLLIFRLRM